MKPNCLIIIGSSTGGPKALQYILECFPEKINASIIVVQHISEKFTKLMADRLNHDCKIKVKEALNEEIIANDTVYIAPGNTNLLILEEKDVFKIKLSDEYKSIYHPSIDATFISASKINIYTIAVILTGMGSDGAIGLKYLKKNNGCYIISQDCNTSIAKGMPCSAIKTGYVDKVLPLEKIPHEIIGKVREYYGE